MMMVMFRHFFHCVFGWFLHGRLRFVLAGFRRARNRSFHVRGLVFGVRTVIVSGFGGGQRRGGQAGGKYHQGGQFGEVFHGNVFLA